MEAVQGEYVVECGKLIQSRPYYVAYSRIQTLALLEEGKGLNWLHYRTRPQPIRTASLLPFQVKIPCNAATPLYQILSPKIKELKVLGMTNNDIAAKLGVNRKTIARSLQIVYIR